MMFQSFHDWDKASTRFGGALKGCYEFKRRRHRASAYSLPRSITKRPQAGMLAENLWLRRQ